MFRTRGRATGGGPSAATTTGAEARAAVRYVAGVSGGTFGAYGIGTGSTESGHRQRKPHRQ
ncbi:hypothetical protein ACQEVC_16355 [Plantactinospora sp. CA-294935]|uniref:hypothetical protein n=1 Tax=Plantactinospora sp. CA-294935 TaxID=3240012 RepID=UPI003D8B1290